MAFPIFQSSEALVAVILGMIAISMWLQKFSFFKNIGPVLTVIVMGIFLSNCMVVPGGHEVYGVISSYCIPVSISLYLLNVDFGQLRKLSKEPWIAIACAVGSVSLVSLVFGVAFGGRLEEGWKIAGMFVGTYTGGSANLTAIAVGLDAASETIAAANAADYVIGIPVLMLMFAAPAILKASKWFQRAWPYHFSEKELEGDDGSGEFMADEKWSIKDIAWLLAIGFTVLAASTALAGALFPESFRSAGRILLISTLSLLLAQIPAVRKLRGNMNLGLFFGMVFLSTIGFAVDIRGFFSSAALITIFCACVIFGSILLHLMVMRLLKVRYEYVLLSITGAIADGSTAALVASGARWKSLVGIGLLMGVIGGVCGNYIGIGVAYAIKAILGAG